MQTTKQVRRMDDVNLHHALRTNRRLLEAAMAKGNADAVKTLTTTLRELNAELTRRERLEAA